MNKMIFIAIFLISVLISSISQALLKHSAQKNRSGLKQYLNPLTMFAYALFGACTLIVIICYKYIPLSLGLVLESTGYIYVTAISAIALKEKITIKKIMGNILIVFGIILFAIS